MTVGKSTITKRWVLNTLGVIIVVLLGVVAVAMMLFKEQYYESVRLTMNSRATGMVSSYFNLSSTDSDEAFNLRAKDFVESFNDKNIMEVWVIDRFGNVVVSSSGFSVANEEYPDYYEAKTAENGKANWIGRTSSGEHIMSLTFMLNGAHGQQQGAVRYIISLQDLDAQLWTVFCLLLFLCLVIIAFVTISGMFFIRSIVYPVKRINETALRITNGDWSARIEGQKYDDEIGQLSTTINNMAHEINETDRMKNEFLSTISHELRTPLTAIKGWGETLLDTPAKDEALQEKGLEVIINESARLSDLVDELLDFSRMESGNMTMRFDRFDLLQTLKEVVMTFKERSLRETIDLESTIPQISVQMYGDENRIKQVFFNVLDNAFKYTDAGGCVYVKATAEKKNTVEITVTDTGCGIAPEDLPHVTEKFYKANTAVRGSGIGLAVVSEIVEKHEGKLEIQSEPGKGTTVQLIFPVEAIQEDDGGQTPKGE